MAFISKNRIYPKLTKEEQAEEDKKPDTMSRSDKIRASMMMDGIETSQIRKRLNNGEN